MNACQPRDIAEIEADIFALQVALPVQYKDRTLSVEQAIEMVKLERDLETEIAKLQDELDLRVNLERRRKWMQSLEV